MQRIRAKIAAALAPVFETNLPTSICRPQSRNFLPLASVAQVMRESSYFIHSPPCRLELPRACLHSSIELPDVKSVTFALLVSFLCCLALGLLIFGWEVFCSSVVRSCTEGKRKAEVPSRSTFGRFFHYFDFSGRDSEQVSEVASERAGAPPEQSAAEPYPELPVLAQFLQRAAEHPEGCAMRTPTGEVRFDELRGCAAGCARLLRPLLSEEMSVVALYLHSGPKLVAAILGTWLAKGSWVPLDRKAPEKRLRELVGQMEPAALICDDDRPFTHLSTPLLHARQLIWDSDCTMPEVSFQESMDRVAQVIYTSGSTGAPKGVIFTHARLAHSTHFFAEQCGIDQTTRVLQKTSNIWSVFRHEVYPALCRAGTIVFGLPKKSGDPMHLAEVIDASSVTLLVATPSVLQLLLDAGELSTLQQVVCMGEPLSWHLADQVLEKLPAVKLMNFYGSTETENTTFSVGRTGMDIWRQNRAVPAGVPQPHVTVHLLRPGSLESAQGKGEICFSGVMATGYRQRPDLTAAAFIDHPELGKLYRTGDLGSWNHQQLVVHGRLDRQVKVRGCRVELGEVEAALGPLVAEVAATVAEGAQQHLQIMAFVCPSDLNLDELKNDVEQRLPSHAVPSRFVALPHLPRLANGKVDLKHLEALAAKHLAKEEQETHAILDSLGVLQHLTKTQLEEERWLHNQQAFWLLLVMMMHMNFVHGAAVDPNTHSDSGQLAGAVILAACHAHDMIAFTLLLGFADARREPTLGARDAVALAAALVSTLIVNPYVCGSVFLLTEWFLYVYVWSRLLLVVLSKIHVGLWQAVLVLCAACLLPDDLIWLQIPLTWRGWLVEKVTMLRWKTLHFDLFFMPGCYLLAWHATAAGFLAWFRKTGARLMNGARDVLAQYMDAAVAEKSLQISICLASWAFFLALSFVPGEYGYLNYKTIYIEGREKGSHVVTWQYMTHPSLTSYVMLWLGEFLLLTLPALAVGLGMAFVPWHFKTMGSTCFGSYISHCTLCFQGWFRFYFDKRLLSRITDKAFDPRLNAAIVLLWNVLFCVAYAHTIGAGFHHVMVRLLKGFLPPQSQGERLSFDQV